MIWFLQPWVTYDRSANMSDCVFNNLGWNNPCLDEVAMFSLPRWLLTICWLWATQGHLGGPLRQLAVASYNKPRAILNCIRFSLCSVNRAWPSFELCQWLMKVMISNTSVKFGLLWHLWNRNPSKPDCDSVVRGPSSTIMSLSSTKSKAVMEHYRQFTCLGNLKYKEALPALRDTKTCFTGFLYR